MIRVSTGAYPYRMAETMIKAEEWVLRAVYENTCG
jgi:hypothetical protein